MELQHAALIQIYSLYDELTASWKTVCQRGCSDCCTRNVTLTSLEAVIIADYLVSSGNQHWFEVIEAESGRQRFQPKITTNQLAELCMNGMEPPEEPSDPSWGDCPMLHNRECPIYPVRPFGCRCLLSTRKCSEYGYAEVDPFMMTINMVMMQCLEHIDSKGVSGNFTDMLMFMKSESHRQNYQSRKLNTADTVLIPNHPLTALMIPPKHRNRALPIIKQIQMIIAPLTNH